jgi:hypothetical protein
MYDIPINAHNKTQTDTETLTRDRPARRFPKCKKKNRNIYIYQKYMKRRSPTHISTMSASGFPNFKKNPNIK